MNTIKKNPVAERSKQWLVSALLELMEEKHYKDITIKEIADKAMLARRTFYRNFKTKEEVVVCYMESILVEYIDAISKETDLSVPSIGKVYFEFWSRHVDFLLLIQKNGLLYLLLDEYNKSICGLHKKVKGGLNLYPSQTNLEYALTFSAGGFFNILIKWVNGGLKETPEEMVGILKVAFKYLSWW